MWKLIFVATLVAGVFGRSTVDFSYDSDDTYDEYSQMVATEYCKATHAADKVPEVKGVIKTFTKCITNLFDVVTISRDLQAVQDSGTYDGILRKYCTKAPEIKECTRVLVEGMAPCLPAVLASTGLKSTSALLDFVCDNDGARVSAFLKEGGPQCFKDKQIDLALCQQKIKSNITKVTSAYPGEGVTSSMAMSEKERCTLTDQGLTCMVQAMKGCSNPTPGKLGQEFHDIYMESMSCNEVSTGFVGAKLGSVAASDDVEPLNRKKLELEIRIAELEMWNRENELNVQHTVLTSDIKQN